MLVMNGNLNRSKKHQKLITDHKLKKISNKKHQARVAVAAPTIPQVCPCSLPHCQHDAGQCRGWEGKGRGGQDRKCLRRDCHSYLVYLSCTHIIAPGHTTPLMPGLCDVSSH